MSYHYSDSFSKSYSEARLRFQDAALGAGAKLYAYKNPRRGPNAEPLCTDVARMGAIHPSRLLIVTSGVHGIEGYAGSAIQTHMLMTGVLEPVPGDMAIVYVHALNPYGFAFDRRTNENNVDLNRNFIDWDQPKPQEHPLTARANEILMPQSWSWPPEGLREFMSQNGMQQAQSAISQGQYSFPNGLFYGGDKAEWSNKIWHKIIRAEVYPDVSEVAHIDLHTGLGPYGHGELILAEGADASMKTRAKEWWGDVKATDDGSSVSAKLTGDMNCALLRELPNISVTSAALEFGTISLSEVLEALSMDNWARSKKSLSGEFRAAAREKMREAFYPAGPLWKKDIIDRAAAVLQQAKAGLPGLRR